MNARKELQKLTDNRDFTKLIKHLESTLEKYIEEQGESQKISGDLASYTEKSE